MFKLTLRAPGLGRDRVPGAMRAPYRQAAALQRRLAAAQMQPQALDWPPELTWHPQPLAQALSRPRAPPPPRPAAQQLLQRSALGLGHRLRPPVPGYGQDLLQVPARQALAQGSGRGWRLAAARPAARGPRCCAAAPLVPAAAAEGLAAGPAAQNIA